MSVIAASVTCVSDSRRQSAFKAKWELTSGKENTSSAIGLWLPISGMNAASTGTVKRKLRPPGIVRASCRTGTRRASAVPMTTVPKLTLEYATAANRNTIDVRIDVRGMASDGTNVHHNMPATTALIAAEAEFSI